MSKLIYSETDRELLYGQIKGSAYLKEVQQVLKEKDISLSDGYVRRVVTGHDRFNDDIWDAIKEVVKRRKQKKLENHHEILAIVQD